MMLSPTYSLYIYIIYIVVLVVCRSIPKITPKIQSHTRTKQLVERERGFLFLVVSLEEIVGMVWFGRRISCVYSCYSFGDCLFLLFQ